VQTCGVSSSSFLGQQKVHVLGCPLLSGPPCFVSCCRDMGPGWFGWPHDANLSNKSSYSAVNATMTRWWDCFGAAVKLSRQIGKHVPPPHNDHVATREPVHRQIRHECEQILAAACAHGGLSAKGVMNCDACASSHEPTLHAAGCTATEVQAWCTNAPVKPAPSATVPQLYAQVAVFVDDGRYLAR
jgi:hypothetical protein